MADNFPISSLWRYPVKGFQGEQLQNTELRAGALLPGDRQWGITAGHAATKEIDKNTWMKKAHFVQLMQYADAAHLALRFDDSDQVASLIYKDKILHTGDVSHTEIADAFCSKLQDTLQAEGVSFPGTIGLRQLQDGGFSDTKTPWISVGGTASVKDFAFATSTKPDIRRFRLNIWVETTKPFEEFNWVGKRAQLGTAIIKFEEPVGRCAAIDVDPDTAIRSNDLPATMRHIYGHEDLGVFATIEQTGQAADTDSLTLLDD